MTRQDFEAIAKILFESNISDGSTLTLAEALAVYFRKSNLRFDEEKFMDAVQGIGIPEPYKSEGTK